MYNIILMDSETEKMGIPALLDGYANISRYYELSADQSYEKLSEADAVITVFGRVSRMELEGARKLRIVSVAAAGYDCVDVQAATSKGVIVTRAGTADVEGVAEHAVCFMVLLSKKMLVAIGEAKRGNWRFRDTPDAFGNEIFGKTAGIVGFGKVGRALARKALGMGMNILVFDPYIKREVLEAFNARQAELREIIGSSDYLCLTAALTQETKHLIGANELASMKPTAFLINVARGSMVDEVALRHALLEKKISGAALDVLESEPPSEDNLSNLDSCIVTPHTAGLSIERYRDVGRVAVAEVRRVLAGDLPTAENWINGEALRARRQKEAR